MNPQDAALLLRDIRDLDPVPWWPLAPGWWMLGIGVIVLLVFALLALHDLRRFPVGSWNRDARRRLRSLKQRTPELSDRQIASEISELQRRIAIARCGREAAAGLSGEKWLAWLSRHDPAGFDWRAKGRILLELTYAPKTDASATKASLKRLIDASMRWTSSSGRQPGA